MDPMTLILLGGAAILGYAFLQTQQQNQSFASFMADSGATEDDIAAAVSGGMLVPVNDTDASQQSSGGIFSLQSLADAITNVEGGPGNLNFRNNNPGNLKFAGQPGATGADPSNGFAIFPDMATGNQALLNQLNKDVSQNSSLTLTQYFAKYLGQSNYLQPAVTNQGNPFTYASSVAGKLGVSPDTTLGQLFGG